MNMRRSTLTLSLTALVGLGAGCDSTTGPREGRGFDAEAAREDYQALDGILASPGMEGFRALAEGVTFGSFGQEVTFAAGVATELSLLGEPGGDRAFASQVARLAAEARSGPVENPIISSFRRGKTFVYDPSVGRYVFDPARPGAPATGVRFILYEPGPGGKPDPTKEIGYADLIDEGDESPQEIALRLVVVESADTILDYRTTVDILAQGGEVTVDGYLQGDPDRLDFHIQVAASADGDGATLDIAFEMGIESREFSIGGSVHGAAGDSGKGGELTLLVRHGTNTLSVEATGSDSEIQGTVYLNGDLFATVEGDPDSPTIRGAGGGELTWTEMLVLRQILDFAEDVFHLFEDLLDPVDELVIIALIL